MEFLKKLYYWCAANIKYGNFILGVMLLINMCFELYLQSKIDIIVNAYTYIQYCDRIGGAIVFMLVWNLVVFRENTEQNSKDKNK